MASPKNPEYVLCRLRSLRKIGVVESLYYLKNKKSANFSEQQLIDCTKAQEYYNFGCQGGFPQSAFKYVLKNGIENEQDYPFIEKDGECKYNESIVVTKLKSVGQVPAKNATALKIAIATYGPVAISVYMGHMVFYKGGIYDDPVCESKKWFLDHAMVAVGYGAENGTDYWIIKNSFGPQYGENGFIRMKRGINSCGIEQEPFYAVM